MSTQEFEHNTSRRYEEDLRATRERLGKPVFPNQKLAHKKILRLVSNTFDDVFRDNDRQIKMGLERQVNFCRVNAIQPNPTIITIQTCLSMIRDMQRVALLNSSSKGVEQSTEVSGVLDFIKGFQMVMNAVNVAYNPTVQGKMLSYPVINSGVATRLDPKGFSFAKREAEFLGNHLRMSDGLIESYEVPELIAAGAKLAAKTYKRMYPFAEKVLPSGSWLSRTFGDFIS